ncbi:MAG: hypothetical protein K6C96_07940 [Butyrivibrio sp.]|nr:hypothetical protein [Butyrivibrio sp.]
MNNFLYNLERKFGKYAIPNLTRNILILYVAGFILQLAGRVLPFNLASYLTLDVYQILHGQVWRLVTWVLIPPVALSIWIIITLYLYYFIGTTMERTIGTFKYNVFIFGGALFMIIAAFVTYGVHAIMLKGNGPLLAAYSGYMAPIFSTYYIQMAVFLTFAISYPDMQLLLMFIIPVKVKWLGIVYAAFLAFDAIYTGLIQGVYGVLFAILSQFINLFLFYLSTGRANHLNPREIKRRQEFKRNVKMAPPGVTRHKCAVCGRTEKDNPNLEFRFCSKCNGNYEYCQDHLFTHQHVQ